MTGPTSDRTAVTGAPMPGTATPRRGEVIGERYEVRHRLRDDPFSMGFLAFDQETEESVLLRIVRPELIDPSSRGEVARELQRVVGMGGKYLPGLIDADRDGHYVYAAETVPEGVSFRDVLDRRIAEGRPVRPEELLPVLNHLEAAVAAIPSGQRHGDLRADQTWLDADRMQVTGAFFVPALPEGVAQAVLQRHGDVRRRLAPEVMRSTSTGAADYYSVAAIAYEALTLQPPPEPGTAVAANLGVLAPPLSGLLHPDPRKRATSLLPLIEGLAKVSGLDVPDLEPAPFRTSRRLRRGRRPTPPPSAALTQQAAHFPEATLTKTDQAKQPEAKTVVVGDPAERDAKTAVRSEPTPSAALLVPSVARGIPPLRREEKTSVSAAPATPPGDVGESTMPEFFGGASEELQTSKMPSLSDEAAAGVLARETRQLPLDDGSHHISVVASSDSDLSSFEESYEDEVPSDPAVEAKPKKESSLDPRMVRMAIAADEKAERRGRFPSDPGIPAEEGDEESSLDPRLVRAALGVAMESSEEHQVPLDPSVPAKARPGGTQELDMGELDFVEEEPGVPLDPSVPAEPKKDGTQELMMDELDVVDDDEPPQREIHGTDQISLEALEEMAADHRREAVPTDLKPMPRVRKDSGQALVAAPSLFDDSEPSGKPSSVVPGAIEVPVVAQASQRPVAMPRDLEPMPRPRTAVTVAPSKTGVGKAIIMVALVLGLGIIIGSFFYARYKQEAADDARRQRLQDRYEQLQQE